MAKRYISWEIIVAGILFTGVAIYLLNIRAENSDQSNTYTTENTSLNDHPPEPPKPEDLSKALASESRIVIDLNNLENLDKELKKLKELKNLEELKHLKIDVEKIAEQSNKSVEEAMKRVEEEMAKMDYDFDGNRFTIRHGDAKTIVIQKNQDASKGDDTIFNHAITVDSPNGKFDLSVARGHLTVEGGDQSQVTVETRITSEVSGDKVKEIANSKLYNDSGTIRYTLNFKDNADLGDSEVNVMVTVPKTMQTHMKTNGGHITATNLQNKQNIKTSGGHISLEDIRGDMWAKTMGGHITLEGREGNADLKTMGGHITVTGYDGVVDVSTQGGHINGKDIAGALTGSTGGGNISLRFHSVTDNVNVSTSAGNISIAVPGDVRARVTLEGNRVSMGSAFSFNGVQNDDYVKGTINGSERVSISAKTNTGNVSLNSGPAL